MIPNFLPWIGWSPFRDGPIGIGNVTHQVGGALSIEARLRLADQQKDARIEFPDPIAVRVVQEGRLVEYWHAGIIVSSREVYVATESQFLSWAIPWNTNEPVDSRASHYGIFTDDLCIEVISYGAPTVLILDQ